MGAAVGSRARAWAQLRQQRARAWAQRRQQRARAWAQRWQQSMRTAILVKSKAGPTFDIIANVKSATPTIETREFPTTQTAATQSTQNGSIDRQLREPMCKTCIRRQATPTRRCAGVSASATPRVMRMTAD